LFVRRAGTVIAIAMIKNAGTTKCVVTVKSAAYAFVQWIDLLLLLRAGSGDMARAV
jgi:hypothetical protein